MEFLTFSCNVLTSNGGGQNLYINWLQAYDLMVKNVHRKSRRYVAYVIHFTLFRKLFIVYFFLLYHNYVLRLRRSVYLKNLNFCT